MPVILLTNYYSSSLRNVIQKIAPDNFDLVFIDNPTKNEILSKVSNVEYLLVGGRIKIDYEILGAATNLKMIQRTGVGLDSIDLNYALEKDIPIYVNPGINSISVAEHTIMLMLSVLKNLSEIDSTLKQGIWKKHEFGIQNHELFGKTIGLIGLGHIGIQVAKMLKPFGVRVLYYKRNRLVEKHENELGVEYKSFTELVETSDIISLHCSLNEKTINILAEKEFNQMKKGVIIINTSRGKLINEKALIKNLQNGKIKGAGLDVFEVEPLTECNELIKLNNVTITPHISGITQESFVRMIYNAFENICHFENNNFEKIEDKLLKNE